MSEDDLTRYIYRIAGGSLVAPKSIREAAHRIVIGFSNEEDEPEVREYIESLYE